MKERNYMQLFKNFTNLNEAEQDEIVDMIMLKLGNIVERDIPESKSASCNEMVLNSYNGKPDCPYCKAEAKFGFIVKNGHRKNVQCFKCKVCGKTFVPTTNTVFSRTRKSADVWRKYIKFTLYGATLEVCAAECDISDYTSFMWRHKLFNVFAVNQNDTVIEGIAEMDETYFRISYKGNHIQGSFNERRTLESGLENKMPRPAYKRGTRNGAKPENSVCALCMVETGKKVYLGKVISSGRLDGNGIEALFSKHVNKDNIFIIADKSSTNKKYLQENNIPHELLLSNTSKKSTLHIPEIKGDMHTQHVNSLHSDIKFYLGRYRGVSTKYLHNYISFCIWLNSMGTAAKRIKKINENTITRASRSDCYISAKELVSFPSVPVCA